MNRVWEILKSEHGGASPMPPELARGIIGFILIVLFVLAIGSLFSWLTP
jgi:hypothetical protein